MMESLNDWQFDDLAQFGASNPTPVHRDLWPTRTAALAQRSPVVPKSLLLPECDRSRLGKE